MDIINLIFSLPGPTHFLHHLNVPNTLVLKEGAPVMLTRNLPGGLCNGARGKVHSLKKDCLPVININGNLIEVPHYRFEVYSPEQSKILASRTQYPIILAYALTVHRAQGQTIEYVDIDCQSFFAPGQLGVAVGRCKSKEGLRVQNFNLHAAMLKHRQCVYDFYSSNTFIDPLDDLSCCRKSDFSCSTGSPCPAGPSESMVFDTLQDEYDIQMDVSDLPQLAFPWTLENFFLENKGQTITSGLAIDFMQSEELERHCRFLYHQVMEVLDKPLETSAVPKWNHAYGELNTFHISDMHIQACQQLFKTKHISKLQNKLSSKLVFWLTDKVIAQKANEVVGKHMQNVSTSQREGLEQTQTSAGQAKIRYIAGVCIHKVTARVRDAVERNIGRSAKRSKIACKLNYKKQKMLQFFRIKEDEALCNDPSMLEIAYKQGPSRGLTIVSDEMFQFFITLNTLVQSSLSSSHFHLHGENIFIYCRNVVDSNEDILKMWMKLFGDFEDPDLEDEIFLTLVLEIFNDITEHFIRIAFVDALKYFKSTIPRKKKQALRSKISALGDRDSKPKRQKKEQSVTEEKKKSKETQISFVKETENQKEGQSSGIKTESNAVYKCQSCDFICEWEPELLENQSIACDKCNCWFHYKCASIKGTETFLKKKSSKWFCISCSPKGKGRGKKSSKK